ncbi:MAG: hypothetical protein GOVbin1454_20 [Prokaryotic dsDNA virus sp.]|nr:MAG: hypothetical protein GOVbin1454_20 [Prokaryotic dsDNA virus sp.]|tara:strand:- start:9815 stop:10363 length:549 start_codon:yes stop_codon:yes gene_type:complete
MASQKVVHRSLEAIANMHGKGKWWVDDSLKMWCYQLEDVSDEDLAQGVKELLRKSTTLPTIAKLLEVMKASTKTAVGVPHEYQKCKACGNTGMRQLARWYRKMGKLKVWQGVAACDCEKGRRLSQGPFPVWSDVVNEWKADKWTEEIYFGTHKEPVIPFKFCVTAEVYERATSGKGNEDASV